MSQVQTASFVAHGADVTHQAVDCSALHCVGHAVAGQGQQLHECVARQLLVLGARTCRRGYGRGRVDHRSCLLNRRVCMPDMRVYTDARVR